MTHPVLLSLEVALPATLFAACGALALAALLAGRAFFGRGLVDALLTAPLVLPPTVLGYFLLVALGRNSALGAAWESVVGTPLVFTRSAAIVAATVSSFPLMFQGIRAALESVDRAYLEAAHTLGASRAKTFWRVTLPLASRGVAASVSIGFARALGDFGVTLMVAGNMPGETQTAALAIYDAVEAGRWADARWLVGIMTLIAVALMAAGSALTRRRV